MSLPEITNPHDGSVSIPLLREYLKGSLLRFIQYFYYLRYKRHFIIHPTISRESHYIQICRALTKVFKGEIKRLIINIPPGHGKSEIMINFIAWTLAHCPESQYLYISYSKALATKHTSAIRHIIELPEYQQIFGFTISQISSAKDNFKTTENGSVKAFGTSGSIMGQDAGLPYMDHFSGCIALDDPHNPEEVMSDVIRGKDIDNYLRSIKTRLRSPEIPIIYIAQRTHPQDLAGMMLDKWDGDEWDTLILPALDNSENALCPAIINADQLKAMRQLAPAVFYLLYQQSAEEAGKILFKKEYFPLLSTEPEIVYSFITGDTAETPDTANDASVFTHLGLYKIKYEGVDLQLYGLHVLNCHKDWYEPKDLKREFMNFYARCMQHKKPPSSIWIEKKSTGTVLLSQLNEMQGLEVNAIERNGSKNGKGQRYMNAQPYIAAKRVTFPEYSSFTQMCIDELTKVNAMETHAHDDIVDTIIDGVQLAFIDKTIISLAFPGMNDLIDNDIVSEVSKMITAQRLSGNYGRSTTWTQHYQKVR